MNHQEMYEMHLREEREEKEAFAEFKQMLKENKYLFRYLWRFGDGDGGYVLEEIKKAAGAYDNPVVEIYKKKTITHKLRKQVFERDEYRCKHCGTHLDLSVDHIHPESKGGETEFDNLQTLCRPCNSRKGVKTEGVE